MRAAGPVSVLLLLAPLLAGCTDGASGGADLPDLTWSDTYTVTTTPLEPFELVGTNVVHHAGGVVALWVENEDDMSKRNVRGADGAWHTTDAGRGWTRHPDAASLDAASARSHRLQTWDVRGLVENAREAEADGDTLVTRTDVTAGGRTHTVTVTATLEGGRVVRATIDSPFDPESPYTAEAGGTLPFPPRVPTDVLDAASVRTGDDAARTAHVRIIGWISDHLRQTGGLPETVDAQSLAVQRLGAEWPANVFTGRPMRHEDDSGHFLWRYCGPRDGTYVGLGWDLSPVGESFGRGCQE